MFNQCIYYSWIITRSELNYLEFLRIERSNKRDNNLVYIINTLIVEASRLMLMVFFPKQEEMKGIFYSEHARDEGCYGD